MHEARPAYDPAGLRARDFNEGWQAAHDYLTEQVPMIPATVSEEMDDAVHIAVDHGRRTLCGIREQRNTVGPQEPRPDGAEGCWTCLTIACELAPDSPTPMAPAMPIQQWRLTAGAKARYEYERNDLLNSDMPVPPPWDDLSLAGQVRLEQLHRIGFEATPDEHGRLPHD